MFGEFNGIVDEVQQHLAKARDVTTHPSGHIFIDINEQHDFFLARTCGCNITGIFDGGLQVQWFIF